MPFYRTRYNRRRGIARSSDRLVKNTSLTLTQILDDVIGYAGGGGGSGSGVIVVIDDQRGSTTPPSSPATGDKYVVPCGATGAWASQDGKIAEYTGSVWSFTTPTEGMLVWVQKYDTYIAYITANATDTDSQFQTLSGSVSTWIPLSARSLTILPVTSQITTPPASPALYAAYIVDPTGTGAWTGGDNHIAIRVCASGAGAWVFIPPQTGMTVFDLALNDFYFYDGDEWVSFSALITKEQVQDWVDEALQAGTHSGITIVYDDANNNWSFAIDTDYVQDLMDTTLVAGTDISITYDDSAGTITIAYTGGGGGGSGTQYYLETVLDRGSNTAPGSPNSGDRYIVGTSPSGSWAGHANDIAEYNGATWEFTDATEGFAVWVADENLPYFYNGTAWVALDVLVQTSVLEEWVEDVVGSLIVAGTNISVTYNDGAGTITIANTFDAGDIYGGGRLLWAGWRNSAGTLFKNAGYGTITAYGIGGLRFPSGVSRVQVRAHFRGTLATTNIYWERTGVGNLGQDGMALTTEAAPGAFGAGSKAHILQTRIMNTNGNTDGLVINTGSDKTIEYLEVWDWTGIASSGTFM